MIDRSKLPNSFEFVVTAGARARQLLAGSVPRVTVGEHKKTTVAQQEVITQGRRKKDRKEADGQRRVPESMTRCSIPPNVIGVTGGIGAYKAVEVARGLQKRGHEVVAVMTATATRFVGPVTFEAITRRRVITDQFEPGANSDIEHIALASTIDLLLDRAGHRQHHRQVRQRHRRRFPLHAVHRDARAGARRAGDEHADVRARGRAAESRYARRARRAVRRAGRGLSGVRVDRQRPSRRARRDRRGGRVDAAAGADRSSGQRILVTAGPTYEDVDPVRYIGNRSSGRMGFAIAAEAARRGAEVTLVAGPTTVEPPNVHEIVRVRSAARDARGRDGARRSHRTSSSWRRRWPTTRPRSARRRRSSSATTP